MFKRNLPLILAAIVVTTCGALGVTQNSFYLPAATDEVIKSFVSGDTIPRLTINSNGLLEWGSGSDAIDTNLYRSAADTLKTDDALVVTGALSALSTSAFTGAVTMAADLIGDGTDEMYGFRSNRVTASTTALTAAQCGSTVTSAGAVVQPLPEASTVLGCRYTFVAGTDDDYDIDPADGTDLLGRASVDGAAIAGSAGDEYRLTDTGSSLTIEAVGANLWAVVSHNGPITDVN